MLASYVLSFSVVPSFARFMLAGTAHQPGHAADAQHHGAPPAARGVFARSGDAFQRGFERFRLGYGRSLEGALGHRGFILLAGLVLFALTGWLATTVGTDFFPTADVGIIKLHYRAPVGTRLEETERLILQVDSKIRDLIPAEELATINDVTGVPFSYNLAIVPSDNVSSADAEITIQLKRDHHPSLDYIHKIRAELPKAFPGSSFYFQNGDIVSQVLNFGLPAPIDIQVQAQNFDQAQALARQVLQAMQKIPGIADPHIVQILNYPSLNVNVDRLKATELGLSQRDVSNNMLIALSTSQLVAPSQFLNPANNVNYAVVVAVPLDKMQSVDDLMSTSIAQPVSTPLPTTQSTLAVMPNAPVTSLQDVATVAPGTSYESLNHYTVSRIIDVAANVDGRDLGGTGNDLQAAINQIMKGQPITTHIDIRGQNEVMQTAFRNLAIGLILAIILVYALLVVLFQSWVDPFIIMMALPGALVGILWMLVLTHTTINVESLMGTIMSVGISVSNSILVVSFANDIRARDHLDALTAVIEAAKTRLRPILMTALAMIIGMIPMALGLGEAGEQNAPLGRAVIGGLAAATLATLFIVPIIYTLLRRKPPSLYELDHRFAAEAAGAIGSTGEGPGPHG
jgi:multidrug efflux pump subunit AcrB